MISRTRPMIAFTSSSLVDGWMMKMDSYSATGASSWTRPAARAEQGVNAEMSVKTAL